MLSRWTIYRRSRANNAINLYRTPKVTTLGRQENDSLRGNENVDLLPESGHDCVNSCDEYFYESENSRENIRCASDLNFSLNDSENLANDVQPQEPSTCSSQSCASFSSSPDPTPVEAIREWALSNKITHTATSQILKIMNHHYDSSLPLDARTLLCTLRNTESLISNKCGGEYHHFGLESALITYLKSIQAETKNSKTLEVFMKVNCDGLPLSRSSNSQIWPILVNLSVAENISSHTALYIIGIFHGSSKPKDVRLYLEDFIEEYNKISTIEINGIDCNLKILYFVCDAPARQFLKVIKTHNSYHGCERCVQKGIYKDTVIFPHTDCELRTDESFKQQFDEDHHKGVSPLNELNIGLVSQFVLDPMHLIYLGVTRKLFHLWFKGPLKHRVDKRLKDDISCALVSIAGHMPSEINRKPRTLNDLEMFKATEFRTLLLYTGVVVLHGKLSDKLYKNFLLLSVSVRLLNSSNMLGSITHARKYLSLFIKHYIQLFGNRNVTYNVHNICHIADDVEKFGNLDAFSAFEFESFLGKLKSMLKKPNKCLSQLVNRLNEQKLSMNMNTKLNELSLLKKQHFDGPILDNSSLQYKELYLQNFCLKVSDGDNCIQVNGQVGVVSNILKCEDTGKISVLYRKFSVKDDFFNYPLKSGELSIYRVSSLSKKMKNCDLSNISKCILLPISKSDYVCIPLLHTLNRQ